MSERLRFVVGFDEVAFPENDALGQYSGKTLSVYYKAGRVTIGSFDGQELTGYARKLALATFGREEMATE